MTEHPGQQDCQDDRTSRISGRQKSQDGRTTNMAGKPGLRDRIARWQNRQDAALDSQDDKKARI
jgi:hypothetical protein